MKILLVVIAGIFTITPRLFPQSANAWSASSPLLAPASSAASVPVLPSNIVTIPCKDDPICGDMTVAFDGLYFKWPQSVPAGVNYRAGSREDSIAAVSMVAELFLNLAPDALEKMTGDALVCGPGLWVAMGDDLKTGLPKAHAVMVVVPGTPLHAVEFHALQTPVERSVFLKVVRKHFSGKRAIIRRLKPAELSYFWALRPYPIEEPIFAVEIGSEVLIAHFLMNGKNPHLFLIDEVVDLNRFTAVGKPAEVRASAP